MEECIFCKIAKGNIPCDKVFENEIVMAFLDISPVNIGHTLIIPKKHFENIQSIPEDYLCEIAKAIKKIAPVVIRVVKAPSFNIGLNNGKEAGQIVPHLHFHIIPRYADDNFQNWPSKKYREGESRKVAEKIRKNIR